MFKLYLIQFYKFNSSQRTNLKIESVNDFEYCKYDA